jgi:hypothetical protein
MPKKGSSRRRRRGGGYFGADESGPGPFGSLPSLSSLNPFASKSTPAPQPPPVSATPDIVAAPTEMAQTAGRRLKKHIGVDLTSPKDARKLLKTAKGDRMLGRKRKTTKRRRS